MRAPPQKTNPVAFRGCEIRLIVHVILGQARGKNNSSGQADFISRGQYLSVRYLNLVLSEAEQNFWYWKGPA